MNARKLARHYEDNIQRHHVSVPQVSCLSFGCRLEILVIIVVP
jgi:hypothetical protein